MKRALVVALGTLAACGASDGTPAANGSTLLAVTSSGSGDCGADDDDGGAGGGGGSGDGGLSLAAVIADTTGATPAPGLALPPYFGMGDNVHGYVTQCLPRNDAIASWVPPFAAGTQWRFHFPWMVILLGAGHVDNDSWRVEVADFDQQVFLRSQNGWHRDASYPLRPQLAWWLTGWGFRDADQRESELTPRATIFDMPNFGEGAANPALHNGVGNGYQDPGDGSDVYSVFVSARARLVPSGNGAFDPSGARVMIEMGSDVYRQIGQAPPNGNGGPSKLVTPEWQYFSWVLLKDGNAVTVQLPANPAVCDGMPTLDWFRNHPPLGVSL